MDHQSLYQTYTPNLTREYGDQYRGNCPFHQEKTKKNKPFCVNMKTGLYHCKGCPAKGNATTFAKNITERIYIFNSNTNLGGYQKLEIENVFNYHKELLDNTEYAPRFWKRDIIKLLKIGWDIGKDNFVFPIFNDKNDVVNVKHHHGSQFTGARATLYPHPLLSKYDGSYIIINEGEKDVVSSLSNGLQAVTSTGGATVIPRDISELMRFKKTYICFDNDSAGDAGIDLWIKRIKEQDSKCNVRVCDISNYVDEGDDVSDYFAIYGKSQESFVEEILERSLWAKMPGMDVPDYLRTVMLSDKMKNLSMRDQIVFFNLILRATRYRVTTSRINGMRVRMRPGEYVSSYGKLSKLCGKEMTPKMVLRAVEKLIKLGFIKAENLKMKRGMKFTLIGWIDGNGHSKSHSEQAKMGIQNIVFLSPEELISKLNNGHSK